MVKSDLKTGMWVKTRDNLWMIIVIHNEPFMIYPDGWMPIKNFPEADSDPKWHILEVYSYNFDTIAGSFQYNSWKDSIDNTIVFTKIYPIIKETIKIGSIAYDKQEFENAVKDLKPINK